MNRQVIEFSKYNPSGNMTILVHSKHDASEYASIANQLMAATHVCCEQVGFIESTQNDDGNDFHLVMSGNEFCVMRRCHIYIICRKVICLKTNSLR